MHSKQLSALSLDSPRWQELDHSFGKGGDIPALLRQVADPVDSADGSPAWSELYNSLLHQGDVHSASLAAVPHVVQTLVNHPTTVSADYLLFPGSVEVGRQQQQLAVPDDLRADYFAALAAIPSAIAAAAAREWDEEFLRYALYALAAAKGNTRLAQALEELNPTFLEEMFEWMEGGPLPS